jgi:phage tail tape-measure protein
MLQDDHVDGEYVGDEQAAERQALDSVSEAPDAHPAGTGLGAAGGAGVGAAVGSLMGPAGAAVGATIGAVAGGLAGKAVADAFNPGEEDSYWRDNYLSRPYADDTLSYDHYRPAYRYGWESRARFQGRRWDEVERDLEKGWRDHRGTSRLGWTDARLAARDAWQRIDNRLLDERERDS